MNGHEGEPPLSPDDESEESNVARLAHEAHRIARGEVSDELTLGDNLPEDSSLNKKIQEQIEKYTTLPQFPELTALTEEYFDSYQEVTTGAEEGIKEAVYILQTAGLEDNQNVGQEDIADLWVERNQEVGAVEDLFYYVLERKQLFKGSDSSNGVCFKDLLDTADKNLPRKIRQLQENRTIRLFVNLGMAQNTAEGVFEVGNKAVTRAARRFGWLATQPFMADFREKARQYVPSEEFSLPGLYAMATGELIWQLFKHIESKNKNYNLSIEWELNAYLRHKDFLERIYVMSMNALHGEKIAKYLPDN